MTIKYEKTKQDIARETADLRQSPIMRFLQNQEFFKFNIGDVVVKQTRIRRDGEWTTELVKGIGAPKKYVYVFENTLGIGYIKQLRVDGSGFTSNLICVANFDPDYSRFILDPEYATHMLIGDDAFQYNEEYLAKKKYRQDAMKTNAKNQINVRSAKARHNWFENLKLGDKFWYGNTHDEIGDNEYTITKIDDLPMSKAPAYTLTKMGTDVQYMHKYRTIQCTRKPQPSDSKYTTNTMVFTSDHFTWQKVMTKEPVPLSDPLCGQRK